MHAAARHEVTRLDTLAVEPLRRLLARYELELVELGAGVQIPGSYWGAPEAGLAGNALFARGDTPLHSVLHEAAHFVCMPSSRRLRVFRDAGGDPDEECAVCYLQSVWADHLPGYSRAALFDDMDAWGYSFREGSSRAWIAGDARHARSWLQARGLVDREDRPTWQLRMLP